MVLLAACGGESSTPTAHQTSGAEVSTESSAASTAEGEGAVAARVLGPNELARSAVLRAVDGGFGSFLGTVEVRAVLERGVFVGFRLVRFVAPDARYEGVELRPGDVVTKVNGSPIERPEEALAIFNGLRVVSELRVEYTRGGERRELRYAIVD